MGVKVDEHERLSNFPGRRTLNERNCAFIAVLFLVFLFSTYDSSTLTPIELLFFLQKMVKENKTTKAWTTQTSTKIT
jgi:hypothetical protein